MGSGAAKGHAARGVTPLRLSIKACPSAVRAVCREAETCPCEGSAVQPLQWPQAFRWDRLERRLPSWSGYYAPTIGRLSGCLASLVAPPSHLCVEARGEILAWHVASNIFDLPFRCDAAECMRRPIGSRVHRERSQRARAKRPAHGRPTKHEVPQPSSSKVATRVRDGPCHAPGCWPTGVRHRRCVGRSVRRLGARRTPQDATWPDHGLPSAWMDQERRARPAFPPGPDKAPTECRFS